ncbi:hypothetical protein RUM44_013523 [Polyplax serrata]|uniref:Uncharacterized protein n=1 Tax=Polyplax serrata TaxID=468196 RepID=A0ABR1BEE9_POLSC
MLVFPKIQFGDDGSKKILSKMLSSIEITELTEALAELCEQEGMTAALTNSFRGGLITGTCALLGGLLLGPRGLAIGGIMGGVASTVSSTNNFESAASIIMKMNPNDRTRLCMKVFRAVGHLAGNNVAALLTLLVNSPHVKNVALDQIRRFLQDSKNMAIQ